jgi:hypothetical protein
MVTCSSEPNAVRRLQRSAKTLAYYLASNFPSCIRRVGAMRFISEGKLHGNLRGSPVRPVQHHHPELIARPSRTSVRSLSSLSLPRGKTWKLGGQTLVIPGSGEVMELRTPLRSPRSSRWTHVVQTAPVADGTNCMCRCWRPKIRSTRRTCHDMWFMAIRDGWPGQQAGFWVEPCSRGVPAGWLTGLLLLRPGFGRGSWGRKISIDP